MTTLIEHARRAAVLGILLLSCVAAGCSDSGNDGVGTLRLVLVDAPADGIEAIHISFSSVRVHRSEAFDDDGDVDDDDDGDVGDEDEGDVNDDDDGDIDDDDEDSGWIEVMDDDLPEALRTVDLLELVGGAHVVLGETELEAGRYSQVRLIIEEATITVDGETHPLDIPSGESSGLKLTHGFTIERDVVTALTLDFDADRSVHQTGNGQWKLRPTIRIVETSHSGTISGRVTPAGSGVLVRAFGSGTTDLVATTYADAESGEYMLQALPPGTYDLEISAEGFAVETQTGIVVTVGTDSEGNDFLLDLLPTL